MNNFALSKLDSNQLVSLRKDLSTDLQDKVYDAINKQRALLNKGQKFTLNRSISLCENGVSFQFDVEIKGQLQKNFTYEGTISTSVRSDSGWSKSDTIKLTQDDISEQGIFSKIWNWIKNLF